MLVFVYNFWFSLVDGPIKGNSGELYFGDGFSESEPESEPESYDESESESYDESYDESYEEEYDEVLDATRWECLIYKDHYEDDSYRYNCKKYVLKKTYLHDIPSDICNGSLPLYYVPNRSFVYEGKKYGFNSPSSTTGRELKQTISRVSF